jgi:hypothetical protein
VPFGQYAAAHKVRVFQSIRLTKVRLAAHPTMFVPHPNLSDEVNHNIVQSEIEGGVFLESLPPATVLLIRTQHHCYTAVLLGGSQALISGHPDYCPQPVLVSIAGCTWGGSMLKLRFLGRGMHLEFHHPEYRTPIVTSAIQEINESPDAPALWGCDSVRRSSVTHPQVN